MGNPDFKTVCRSLADKIYSLRPIVFIGKNARALDFLYKKNYFMQ